MPGSYFNPIKRIFLNLSGGTVTGDTTFTQGVYATNLSGETFYSGSTLLDTIITNIAASVVSSSASTLATYIQPGSNITTGGTALFPIISVVASPSFNGLILSGAASLASVVATSISATTISGGTLFSGNTNLYDIFSTIDTNDITRVQPGSNITTGGTANNPSVSVVSSPSLNNISFSGTATGVALSATTISGGTIYSGSTDLYSIFSTTDTNDITRVQSGSNITTGGTANNPSISVVASPSFNGLTLSGAASLASVVATSLSATTISGGTLFSGSTNLYSIFSTTDTNDITRVQPGSNITTGGTAGSPIVSVVDSPSLNNLSFSGTAIGVALSATTFSAGTIYSGSTDLYSIFSTTDTNDITRVQPGSNITTGGTANNPSISVVDSPSLNNISFSGIATGGAINATSLSATSLTDTRVLFAGANGLIKDDSNLTFDSSTDTLNTKYIIIGAPGQTGTTATIYGDILVVGEAISGFTSELFIEDNFIELNYNPTASTASTSLGAGWAIQDGSGVSGTDVFLDIRGASTGVSNRGFATNLNDIYIRESGSTSSPGGVRVIAENDTLDGGSY